MPGSFKIVWSLEGMKLNGIPAVTMAQDHGTRPWHKIPIKPSNNLKQTGF